METCQSAQTTQNTWKGFLSLQNGILDWARQLIWQLSRRQSLTPFTRRVSHKHSLPRKLAVHRVLCKHINRKLSGRKKCGRKRCTTNRENRSLMRIVKQNRFKNLGELHKEWTEAGVKASRATTHRRVKEFGYRCRQRRLTWAKKKNWTVAQWSKVLFSDESKFCISFGNQGPRVWRKGGEAHGPSCLKSSVSTVCDDLGCNVICWCWSIVFFENQRHCKRLPRNVIYKYIYIYIYIYGLFHHMTFLEPLN